MPNAEANRIRDAKLVHRTLKNPDDFKEIILRYQLPIRRYIIRMGCRDANDADDLLQDIFLKVYVNLNDFDAELTFSSWLYRIAHNEAISFFRKKNVRPISVATEEETRLFENIPDEIDFIKSFDEQINADMLRKALGELKQQYRDVLILKFFEEKSYTEISDILKFPMGTVATLINRGKKQLKEALVSKNIDV